jgi:8-oxo-dGTP pyrophosphatase MutT (NUDIX family)
MSRPGDRRREAVRAQLACHAAVGAAESDAVAAALALLDNPADPFSRETLPGHFTASAVVLTPDADAVLLVRHRRLGRWLQPGGHAENLDASLLATAIREVREETGIEPLDSPLGDRLLHVALHEIPPVGSEPAHLHHDIRFLLVAPRESTLARVVEVDRATWFRTNDLERLELDASLQAALSLARMAFSRD